jgi:hypothetical protein
VFVLSGNPAEQVIDDLAILSQDRQFPIADRSGRKSTSRK